MRLIIVVLSAFAAASSLSAITVTPQDFVYTLHLPSIVGTGESDSNFTDYAFSWVGPLKINALPNSACPTVCGPVVPGSTVETGFRFNGFSFTASQSGYAEADIYFTNGFGSTITFDFIEPDAFWANSGNTSNFAVNNSVPATTGVGASYIVNTADPGCSQCSVTISQASTTTTPEPASFVLLASVLVGGLAFVRRRSFQS